MIDWRRILQSVSSENPGQTSDDKWDLFEIIPLSILTAVGLVVVGSIVDTLVTITTSHGDDGFTTWVTLALFNDWASIDVAFILLGAMLLCWWQLQRWLTSNVSKGEEATGLVHVKRIWAITRSIQIGFIVLIIGVVLTIVSAFGLADFPHPTASDWGDLIAKILYALGVILIAVLSLFIADRILFVYPVAEEAEQL